MSPDARKVWSIAVEQYEKDYDTYVEYLAGNPEEVLWSVNGTQQLHQAGYIEPIDRYLLTGEDIPIPCPVRFKLTDRGRTVAEFGERNQ